MRDYYDTWGSRCYAFTGTTLRTYMYSKNSTTIIKDLRYNLDKFKEMGGEYIFSGVPIANSINFGLEFHGDYSTEQSYYRIYLYRAI